MKNEKCMDIPAGYIRSMFQDIEVYLRTEMDSVEDGFR